MADGAAGSTRRLRLSNMRDASTRSQVYAQLRSEIIWLTLEPGQALSESELAELYGVSRTPVREALIRLANEDLVEVVPQLGTYVARISIRDVTEGQFIRETLERASLPHAIDRISAADEARLRQLLAQQSEAADRGDLVEWFATDEQFHRALLEIGGHPKTWTVVSAIKAHLDRLRILYLPDPTNLSSMHAQHSQLVDHIAGKRRSDADELLASHLQAVLGILEPMEKKHPDYFQLDDERNVRARRPTARASADRAR